MGFTHYFRFVNVRGPVGTAAEIEKKYQLAVRDCQKIVKRFYRDNGGISGFSAHTAIGVYGGLQVNGKRPLDCEPFELREHFRQNLESDFMPFCKTARLPYDTIVVACLAVLKHRLGEAIEVSSDGSRSDWADGVKLAKKVTGLKLKNPIAEDNPYSAIA